MLKNKEILKLSIENKDEIFIENIKTENWLENNINFYKNFIDLVKSFSTIESSSEKEKIFKKIKKDFLNNEMFSYLDFSSYLFTFNITKSVLKSISESEIKKLLSLYYIERIKLYENLNIPINSAVMQILKDEHSSRKKGKYGQKEISKILLENNFKKFDCLESGKIRNNEFSIKEQEISEICKREKINFEYKKNNLNKNPDFIFKFDNSFFIGEHKYLKEFGGAQSKQILETIKFISYNENNIYYISIIESFIFEKFFEKHSGELNKILNESKNFYCNKEGFKKLINSL